MGFHSQAFNFPDCSSKGLNLPFAFFASDLHLREIEKKCSPSSLPPWRKEKKGRQEELLWAAAALGLFPRTQPPFGFLPAISLGWLEKLCQLQGLPHPWGMGETGSVRTGRTNPKGCYIPRISSLVQFLW